MKLSSLAGHVVELLDLIRTGREPADNTLRTFYRTRHYLGAKDRRAISEQCYDIIRHLRLLEWYARKARATPVPDAAGDPVPSSIVYVLHAALMQRLERSTLLMELEPLLKQTASGWSPAALLEAAAMVPEPSKCLSDPSAGLALRFSLPDFLVEEWVERFGESGAEGLCRSSNEPAPAVLRVNTLKCTRDACRDALGQEGVAALPATLSPFGLRLERRVNVQGLRTFRLGWFEMQDEGSQILSLLLGDVRGKHVVDACAGGGGKTLHLAALMNNEGELSAVDVDPKRLEQLSLRARRAGATVTRLLEVRRDKDVIAQLSGGADAVLVDAPCSGSGTLRRNPWLRLTLTRESAGKFLGLQKQVLESSARLVKPGGRLVYATCSLLRGENEGVVEHFLSSRQDFSLEDARSILRAQGIEPGSDSPYLQLRPDQGPSDGYFAAVLRRRVDS